VPCVSMMSFQTPSMICRSVRHNPAAPTLTITSSGAVIVGGGTVLLYYLAPVLIGAVREAGLSLQYSFTLVGAAVLLGLINISRGVSLFSAAFAGTLLVLWVR